MPYFQWNPQAFAATYLVEIYRNGDTNFSPANKVLSQTTKFSAWAPTQSLASGDYAWRVRRNDADNRARAVVGRPDIHAPAARLRRSRLRPTASGYGSNNLLLTWSGRRWSRPVQVRSQHEQRLHGDRANPMTVMSAWAPTAAIADGTYCWRVKVLDAAGNSIATSAPGRSARTRPSRP